MKKAFLIMLLLTPLFSASTEAAPFEECPIEAFLVQGNPAKVFGVQLGTGYYSSLADNMGSNNRFNAAGFSSHDGHIYGYSYEAGALARVGNDYVIEPITVNNMPNTSFYVGDVAVVENSYYAYRSGSNYGLYRIDLDGGEPYNAQRVVDGSTLNLRIYDLAFHPTDGYAYAVDGNGVLWRIDPQMGSAISLGNVGESGTFGAAYFDRDGTLYISNNNDGKIYRISVEDSSPAAELFAFGPASSSNDGARCALAPITSTENASIDFGDAPESYGTFLAENGARHDQTNSTLFLGQSVDSEADAWASPASDDDQNSHDDDGVQFVTGIDIGSDALLSVQSSDFGYLNAWIDFDQNGQFDAEEQILSAEVVDEGSNTLRYNVPLWAETGNTWARFRVSSEPDLLAIGGTSDGEVEDYAIEVSAANLEITSYPGANSWSTIAFEDTWPLQGDYDMNDVVIHQRLTQYRDATTGLLLGVRIKGEVAAIGASFHNGFAVRLPGVARSDVNEDRLRFDNNFGITTSPLEANRNEAIIVVANDLWDHTVAGEGCEFYRTSADCGGPVQMAFDIYVPVNNVDVELPVTLDPFIFATQGKFRDGILGGTPGRALEIHLKNQSPTEAFDLSFLGQSDDASSEASYFHTATGLPWAIELSQRWAHPLSGVDLIEAYPAFVDYIESEGASNTDWYTTENSNPANTFEE